MRLIRTLIKKNIILDNRLIENCLDELRQMILSFDIEINLGVICIYITDLICVTKNGRVLLLLRDINTTLYFDIEWQ